MAHNFGILPSEAWCPACHHLHDRFEGEVPTTAHFSGQAQSRATRQVRIWIQDVPTIILHALALQHFMVAARCFRQAHGSPMGSPLSPALCGMVIAAQEEIWHRTFSITGSGMNRNLLSLRLRYVDNRLWISERRFEQLPGVRLFVNYMVEKLYLKTNLPLISSGASITTERVRPETFLAHGKSAHHQEVCSPSGTGSH